MAKIIIVTVLLFALTGLCLGQDEEAITSNPSKDTEDVNSGGSSTTSTTTSAPSAPKTPETVGLEGRSDVDNSVDNRQARTRECTYDNISFKAGDKRSLPNECTQLTCHPDGMITGVTCPFAIAPPECTIIPQDLSKPYPHCCESWTC